MDAWLLQQAIVEDAVDLVVETGTYEGGSALYMASIFDLLERGHVISVDVVRRRDVTHPRVDFVIGSSTDGVLFDEVASRVASLRPAQLMVLLDSDHSAGHVRDELKLYAELLRPGEYIVVEDGCIDELRMYRHGRPGPLKALEEFVKSDPRFEIDEKRSSQFLLSHSPKGWLRRVM
jgi:cephalosporin hydroxylase